MHFSDIYHLFLRARFAVSVFIAFGQGSCLRAQPSFWDTCRQSHLFRWTFKAWRLVVKPLSFNWESLSTALPVPLYVFLKKWKWSRSAVSSSLWPHGHQAPPSMGFSRQEYWSGLPFPSPGNLPNPGIEPSSPTL